MAISDSCRILMECIVVINFLKQSMKVAEIRDAIFEEKDGKR
jgi:hypothetical protein